MRAPRDGIRGFQSIIAGMGYVEALEAYKSVSECACPVCMSHMRCLLGVLLAKGPVSLNKEPKLPDKGVLINKGLSA